MNDRIWEKRTAEEKSAISGFVKKMPNGSSEDGERKSDVVGGGESWVLTGIWEERTHIDGGGKAWKFREER